jgi:hypothetical protein
MESLVVAPIAMKIFNQGIRVIRLRCDVLGCVAAQARLQGAQVSRGAIGD